MESLTLTPHNNTLNGIILYENVDYLRLGKLIHSSIVFETKNKSNKQKIKSEGGKNEENNDEEGVEKEKEEEEEEETDEQDWWLNYEYTNEKTHLTKYYENIVNGQVSVRYCKNNNTNWGRCNPYKSLSLGAIRREIRHTIASQYYTDIDICNCHAVLIYQICKKHGIPYKLLESYVNKRNYYLEMIQTHYSVSRCQAKELFIALMYGGKFQRWASCVKTDMPALPFIDEFIKEMELISREITHKNPEIYECVLRKKQNSKTNFCVYRSTLSTFAQEIESRILEVIYWYLVEHKYIIDNNAVLCSDGIMIETSRYRPCVLRELERAIKEKTGFEVSLETKPMDQSYRDEYIKQQMTFDLHSPMFTTGLLSDYFRIMYNDFIFYENRLYLFNGIYWEEDERRVNIYNFIDSVFYRELMDYYFQKKAQLSGEDKDKDKIEESLNKFHKNVSLLRQIKYKKTLTEDICNKIYNRDAVFNNKPYIFAFNNAIYDLERGQIIEPNRYHYISITCGYNYDPYHDPKLVKQSEYNQLLSTIFPNRETGGILSVLFMYRINRMPSGTFICSNWRGWKWERCDRLSNDENVW